MVSHRLETELSEQLIGISVPRIRGLGIAVVFVMFLSFHSFWNSLHSEIHAEF